MRSKFAIPEPIIKINLDSGVGDLVILDLAKSRERGKT